MQEIGAQPPDQRTRSAGLETGEDCPQGFFWRGGGSRRGGGGWCSPATAPPHPSGAEFLEALKKFFGLTQLAPKVPEYLIGRKPRGKGGPIFFGGGGGWMGGSRGGGGGGFRGNVCPTRTRRAPGALPFH